MVSNKVLQLTIDDKIEWVVTKGNLSGKIGNFSITITMLSGDYCAYYLVVYKDEYRVCGEPISNSIVNKIQALLQERKENPLIEEFINL